MKCLAVFALLFASSAFAATLAEIRQQAPTVAEALDRVKAITGVYFTDDNLKIRITSLNSGAAATLDCSSTHRWGAYSRQSSSRGYIDIDPVIAAVTPESKFASAGCTGSAWDFAVSVTVHELGHHLAESMAALNANFYAPWRTLGAFANNTTPSLNLNAAFLESPYAFTDVREYVAVSFEGYMLDPLFACHHAAQAQLFDETFGVAFAGGPSCPVDVFPVQVGTEVRWVPLRREAMKSIVYREDGDGVQIWLLDRNSANALALNWAPRESKGSFVSGLSLVSVQNLPPLAVALPESEWPKLLDFLWESTWRQKISASSLPTVLELRHEFLQSLGGQSASIARGLRWVGPADLAALDVGNFRYRGIPLELEDR